VRFPSRLFKIPRIRRKRIAEPAPGSPPGTLVVSPELPRPVIWRTVFDQDSCETEEVPPERLAEALAPEPGKLVWVDIQGLGDAALLSRAGEALQLGPLTVEDIAHVHQRPKLEEFDDHLFLVLRAVRLVDGKVDNEQLSFVLKQGLLVTFQERAGDGFDPVRRRLKEGKGKIRVAGMDYILYALLDATIDNYFPVLDLYGDSMESLDDEVRENPTWDKSATIHLMRRELRQLRRAIWPVRDVTSALGRSEVQLISKNLQPALRDCHDHVIQVVEFIESARERAADLAGLYTTMVGERANQVMKVLTIIATIFIPLTFLCGLYGMNFDTGSPYNMPELKWRFGYLFLWGVMLVVVLGMLLLFRHKGWIGGGRRDRGGP
jgi:magnesium transporter